MSVFRKNLTHVFLGEAGLSREGMQGPKIPFWILESLENLAFCRVFNDVPPSMLHV